MKERNEEKIRNKDISVNSDEHIINNDETTDNRFIPTNKKNNNVIEYIDNYKSISLEETFLLRYSDPVNSISLTDNYLLYGSMIGKVIFYNIPKKHFYQLYDLTNESIMGSSLENKIDGKNIHFIAIGDESVVSIFEKENEQDIEANTIYNYKEKDMHSAKCPESFTLLWKNKALIIELKQAVEYNEDFENKKNEYSLITYDIENRKEEAETGIIEMSNYSVPFDFRDNLFLFLEHCPNQKRLICTYEFNEDDNENKNEDNKKEKRILITLDKNFGHISFLKILNKNTILMVRNYNIIEIYDIKKSFKLLTSYNNNYELNAIDFYEINNNNDNDNDEESNDNILNANIIFIDIEQNIVEMNFSNNKLTKIFHKNAKDIDDISNDLKMKGLFDLDFPYYIKNSPNFIALTTDQACFLFRKEK